MTRRRLISLSYGGSLQASGIVYNAADQTTQMLVGANGTNQVTEDYIFDSQTGLLTNQKATRGGTELLNLSYDYARNNSVGTLNGKTGHLTKVVDNLNNNKNREYEFDAVEAVSRGSEMTAEIGARRQARTEKNRVFGRGIFGFLDSQKLRLAAQKRGFRGPARSS